MPLVLGRLFALLFVALAAWQVPAVAESHSAASASGEDELTFVVYLTRHGVRSPTGKADQYNKYSAAPWPEWPVQPGYLTAHGYQLTKLFGVYDRARLAADGLLAPAGCADAAHVSIVADSDQRTHETGKALAEGMFPGCSVNIDAQPEGTADPLFHFVRDSVSQADRALARSAVQGRIGGDPGNLTEAYRAQLAALDKILAGCGHPPSPTRISLFDIPATEAHGDSDHAAGLHGPLTVASTLSENLLLEYTEGMTGTNLGWGCLDEASLRQVMQLHTAAADFTQRTPTIARMTASNLLVHILKSIEQSADEKPVPGAVGRNGDRVLFLVGHDTNIATVAGALGLTWIIDGIRDSTPPGGALIFELWRAHSDGKYFVRIGYTAQTLRQMRDASNLTLATPPERVPVFLPNCSRQDQSCSLEGFASAVRAAVETAYTKD
jgi:4-phytase / acid phosphatase